MHEVRLYLQTFSNISLTLTKQVASALWPGRYLDSLYFLSVDIGNVCIILVNLTADPQSA